MSTKRANEMGSEDITTKKFKSETPVAVPKTAIQENEVGITSYINKREGGFNGTIKSLYSDFQVNEIDLEGNVVHLLDEGIDVGKTKKERKFEKRSEERKELQGKTEEEVEEIKAQKKAEEENKPKYELSDEHRQELLTYITKEELAQVEELFTTGNNMETTTSFDDKSVRGKIHQLFRAAFQGKLETITSEQNTFKIAIAKRTSRGRQHPQESMHHIDENGVVNYGLGQFKNYLHFTVFKENRETMEVASTISKFLRIPHKSINYAGTKDRRGATCQKFSIHKGKVIRVNSLNKALKNTVLGGFTYEDTPLALGDLKGNEFTITIRDLAPLGGAELKTIVEDCFNSLKEKGFINYFGMQRFGSFSISTHALGIHILKEEWKQAAELILSEQDVVAPASIEARKIWAETQNPSLTLKHLPHYFSAETSILRVLEKEQLDDNEEYGKNSYFKSIMAIPKNLRMMYSHAYQSYVWNLVASKRIEMFGLDLQEGDLVLDDEVSKKVEDDDFEEDVAINKDVKVKALSKEDIESGKYSIYDVVLPTPGYKIEYPSNEKLVQVYVDTMAKDGLDPHKMGRRIKEFSLTGSYRNVMAKPENMSYELINYKDNNVPLVRTDLEVLRLKKEGQENVDRIIRVDDDADKTAVVLKMQLGVSSYATMALREFMKADTARWSENMVKSEEKTIL
ncbi:pseudouridine synthase [Scheffersomyces xylosifermentans]|uniref:pseudouridine synthase n=1 Tax=Scheffersomyces xylosifermentans TaxID=1304137 RepID=UPI00315CDE6B